MLSPQENISPSVVRHNVCPNPPATLAAFLIDPLVIEIILALQERLFEEWVLWFS